MPLQGKGPCQLVSTSSDPENIQPDGNDNFSYVVCVFIMENPLVAHRFMIIKI
jgi:hypothetical protein